jgi:uncharacterized phage protein (TIGR02220 family)
MELVLRLATQPRDFRSFWLDILSEYSNGKKEVYYKTLLARYRISSPSFYRWIKTGITLLELESHGLFIVLKVNKIVFENKEVIKAQKPVRKRITKPKVKTEAPVEPKVILENNDVMHEIIKYFNQSAGKSYSVNSKQATKFIALRLNEGFSFNDFKKVIDVKSAKWLNTSMQDYLRPETLFGSKFETYLNENIPTNGTQERFIKVQRAVDQAKSFNFFNDSES